MGLYYAGRRAIAVAAVAIALLAVALPSAAFAKTTFTSKVPAPSSASTRTLPTVSVYVTDTYGIKGASSFTMTIDGKRVTPKITYKKRGDYKRVTLSYHVTTALKVGAHTVVVKIKNVRKRAASTTWKFTVSAPPAIPTVMPVSITATDCDACHVTYPAAHRMTQCAGCHHAGATYVDGRPLKIYTPADDSAHTLACSQSLSCHAHSTAFPHVLDDNCSRCHGSAAPQGLQPHSVEAESAHATSDTWCVGAGCHVSSLTAEHVRYVVGGARLSCATCHSSKDARIVGAIKSRSTACDACHDLPPTHIAPSDAHSLASPPSCVGPACHNGGPSGTSVTAIHAGPGCSACHRGDMAPTLTCSACHTGDGHPAHTASPAPAVMTVSGTAYGVHACIECHPQTDLRTLHGGATGCRACHPTPATSAKPWLGGCVQGACHSAGALKMHATIDASHTLAVAPGCTAVTCHVGGANVVAIHAAVPGRTDSGCGICHANGATPTLVCATCHPAGSSASHASHPASITSSTITINGVGFGSHLCTECHATTELQSVHGGISGCGKCHPSPRSTLGAWNGGCVQGGCHVAGSALAMHGAVDSAHVTTLAAGCSNSSCHTGGNDVARIHAVGGRDGRGCPICHRPGATPALTCTTPGCHSSAAASLHTSHPATVTSASISIGGISYGKHACSECHATTDLMAAHDAFGGCATCHPSPRDSIYQWNGGCVQGNCHKIGTAVAMHGSIESSHTLASAPTCTVARCHAGGSSVAAIHAAVAGRTDSGCGICHTAGTTATLVCASAGCHPNGPPAKHGAHPATITSATVTILGTSYGKHLCTECHPTTELQALHGGATGCSTCHPSPRSSFSTWNGGCVQGGCHAAGTALAMHASIDTSHTARTGSCVSSACHASNVVALHAPGPGCAACHAAGKTLTLACVTAGCHPNGAPPTHQSHPAAVTSGTITINSIAYTKRLCSECHATTELQAVHGGSTSCAKCHPTPRSSFTTWGGGCVQGACHASGTALAMHGSVNASHTVASAASCTIPACHTGGTDIAVIHDAVAGRTGSGCAICHAPGVRATSVCSTAGCHSASITALHASHPAKITSATITINGNGYGKRLCTECHVTTELQAAHGGASSCAKCHPSPRSSVVPWSGGCVQADCHKPGSSLAMHGSVNASHTASAAAPCTISGCHLGGTDIAAVHAMVPARPDFGCGICHTPGGHATLVCASSGCHPIGPPAKHSSHPATITTGTITILGTAYPGQRCGDCHASTELQAVHGGSSSCAKCHPAPRSSFTYWDGGCVQGACHLAGTNHAMHAGIDATHTAPTAPSCTLSDCHTGGTDVAKIHAAKGGCADCHGPGRTPSLDCSTCHGTDLIATHAPYIGTNHQVTSASCIVGSCHQGQDAAQLHAASVGCTACHTKSGTASAVCLDCHRLAIATKHPSGDAGHAYSTHPCNSAGCHLANSAAVHAYTDHSCGVCHKATGTTGSACTNCHSYSWASRHSGYLASNDYHGAAIGTGWDEQGMGFHSEGWILPPYTRGDAASPNANLACSVCHDPVGTRNYYNFPNVVNGRPVTVTTGYQYVNLCVACHGGTVDQWHAGCFYCHEAGHGSTPGWTLTGRDCSACHHHGSAGWPHSSATVYGPTL